MSVYQWSLTASDNATADSGVNWQEGQSPSTINNSARAMMAAVKAGFNDLAGVSALGGAGDTFALSLSQPMTSLTNAVVGFFATRNNTGAVTLNVDGLGAKPLRIVSGTALVANAIVSGTFYVCGYNPATSEWLIVGRQQAIANAELAPMANNTFKGNISGSSAAPSDVSLAAISALLGPAIPTGGIIMWSGSIASVPTGWFLCDGTNSTPDLRNKFIIGASADAAGIAKTSVTGSATQSGGSKDAIAVAHTHTGTTTSNGAHSHNLTNVYPGPATYSGGASAYVPWTGTVNGTAATTDSAGAHTHSFITDSTGSSGTDANLPPYYALAFIMKG